MPLHDFRCPENHVFEVFVGQGQDTVDCPWHMGKVAEKVFLTPPMGFVQRDICYDSPVDGRPITNKHAREDDLKRNGCIPYEPGMRQDAERVRREADAELDKSVEASVDEFFATAPTRKLEKLDQELRAGASVETVRSTPDLTKGVAP